MPSSIPRDVAVFDTDIMHTDTVTAPTTPDAGPFHATPEHGGGVDYAFGDFTLYPARKLLVRAGAPVPLGGRAFDLLVALVTRADEVVGHHDLVAAVWPRAVVEENGLRVHMSSLRKALGETPADQFILTVLGRGYRFVKPVRRCLGAPAADALPAWPPAPGPGAPLGRLIGREAAGPELAQALARARVVTLAGPGGVGKSAVALAYAAEHARDHADGCHVIDFAALDDMALVPAALGAALGLPPGSRPPQADLLAGLCAALCDRQALLVFDNCEHVLPAVAGAAARILAAAPRVVVLATSRAPLGTDGEAVLRLPPLALPAPDAPLDCRQAMQLSAIALFVERAAARSGGFALTGENLPHVVTLCRQLDGLPLAIELAAARVEALGVAGLVARLDDMLRLLTRSRRLVAPRHAGLETMLDCSYRLLDDTARAVLRRLSVCHAAFASDMAVAVCAFDGLAPADVLAALAALAAGSLLTVESDQGEARYRWLNTTRRYAAHRLAASGETDEAARRHAAQLLALLRQAGAELGEQALAHWQRRHGGLGADLLPALDWAFGPAGQQPLGFALCAAVPLPLVAPGMADRFQRRLDTALATLARGGADCGAAGCAALEARLLAIGILATSHVAMPAARRAAMFERLLPLAAQAGAPDERALVVNALCLAAFAVGDHARLERIAADAARQAGVWPAQAALPRRVVELLAERWSALALHFQGRHREARAHVLHTLGASLPPGAAHALGPIPRRVAMGVVLARTEWLEGAADAALARARQCVILAEHEHPFALALALGMALAPVALWRGDEALALAALARLETHARRYALGFWCEWAQHLRQAVAAPDPGRQARFAPLRGMTAQPLMLELLVTVRPDCLDAATLAGVGRGQATWCDPELLRVRAERARAGGAPLDDVESGLARAFVAARAQGALAWELRCAISLAGLWRETGRAHQGQSLLADVMARFHQGRDTADLRAALALQRGLAIGEGAEVA